MTAKKEENKKETTENLEKKEDSKETKEEEKKENFKEVTKEVKDSKKEETKENAKEDKVEEKQEEVKEEEKEEKQEEKKEIPEFGAGDLIRVHQRVKKGNDKTYIQVFEGIVLARKHGNGLNATFTIRKEAFGGVGVEKIFPLHLPAITKIEVVKRHKVRRSKLYYLRSNKKKLKEKK